MDTEIGCFMKPEVAMQRRKFSREFKVEAVKLVRERGVSAAQAARDLDVHENVLRKWVKEFGSDPVQAFPGHGQMKPAQQEIERLRREVNKLKAERAAHDHTLGQNHEVKRSGATSARIMAQADRAM